MAYIYTVVENTPGYLPDDEPAIFIRRRDAERYAASLAAELREQGYKVTGNSVDGYYAERDANDLGRVIEVYRWTAAEAASMGLEGSAP